MKTKEDLLINLRSIFKRPVESLLLVLGISLGIGATASGFTIVFRTMNETSKQLAQTHYKEIVVSVRQSSEDMDLPAELRSETDVYLTPGDLKAKEVSPDIEYAYIRNRTQIHFGSFRWDNRRNSERQNRARDNFENQEGDNQGDSQDPPEPPPDFRQQRILPEAVQTAIEELDGFEVSPEYFNAYGLHASQGSLFTEDDMINRAPLLILGSNAADILLEQGNPLGKQVQIWQSLYTVSGILEPTGTNLDEYAYIPVIIPEENENVWAHRRFFRTSLSFTVKDIEKLDEAKAQITSWFNQIYGAGTVFVSLPKEESEALIKRNERFVTIIFILALSGLLIACVNVSNILYSRAFRKRKSIGILKALGAAKSRIFQLFFIEALIIGIGGAAAGTGIAILLSNIIQVNLGISGYSIGILILGVILSWGTTMLLTDIPAMQAAKIPASEAIRYE